METPISKKEYDNWGTYNSAVFMRDKIVLNPEIKDSKGGIHNTNFTANNGNWIAEMKLSIGNTAKTNKGGNGVGIHYLKDFDSDDIGTHLFGYTKSFRGMAVYINTILSAKKDDKSANYIQGFMGDGLTPVNVMKTKDVSNCLAVVRNLPDDQPLMLRIEYHKPELFVLFYDYEKEDFEQCFSYEADLNYPGVWLITAGNGLKNPDHVYIDSFAVYDLEEKVSVGHN